jgi:hypothetical protein
MRIQELLLELQQKAELETENVSLRDATSLSPNLATLTLLQTIEELKQELEEKAQTVVYLEEKVLSLSQESQSADVVSRSQVEEMESMFVETINQLAARVMQLEEDKHRFLRSHSSADDLRNENIPHSHHLPAVPLPPRGVRIEPGKVRVRAEPTMNGWINGKTSAAASASSSGVNTNRTKARF